MDAKVQEWVNEIIGMKIPHGQWAEDWSKNGYDWRPSLNPCEDAQVRDVRTCAQKFEFDLKSKLAPSLKPSEEMMGLQHQNGMIVQLDGGENKGFKSGWNVFLKDYHPSNTPRFDSSRQVYVLERFWFCSRPLSKENKKDAAELPKLGKKDIKFLMNPFGGGGGTNFGDFW